MKLNSSEHDYWSKRFVCMSANNMKCQV